MPWASSLLAPLRLWRGTGATDSTADPVSARSELISQHGILGLLGSILIAVGAFGVGYLPKRSEIDSLPFIDVLRETTVGAVICKIAVVAGAVLLLRAWLLLGGDVRSGRIVAPQRLVRMFWYWSIPLIIAPPLFSQDVYSYVAQGNLMRVGFDPYHVGPSAIPNNFIEPVSSFWLDTPAPYGPVFLFLAKMAVVITHEHVYLAALLLRVLALVGVWLIARYLPRLARSCGADPTTVVWVALLNPLVFMHFVSGAHNDALMVGLLVAGFALAFERHAVVGVVLISMAGTIKAPALIGLGFVGLIWAGQNSSFGRKVGCWAASAGIAILVFLAANFATGLDFGWVGALDTPGIVKSWLSPVTLLGTSSGWILNTAGGGQHTDLILTILRLAALAAVLAFAVRWLIRKKSPGPVRAVGAVLLMLAVFGPVIQPWYLLWGVILLAAAGFSRRELPWVVAGTAAFVVHGLANSSATSEAVVIVSSPFQACIAIAAALIGIFSSRRARSEILSARSRWAEAQDHVGPADVAGEDAVALVEALDVTTKAPAAPTS